MSKEYGPLDYGSWSANYFESMLTQLKEGNTFILKARILYSPDPKWTIILLKIMYKARVDNSGDIQVWVTNDERRRIIKVLNDTRKK